MHFQITLIFKHVAGLGLVPFSEVAGYPTNKKKTKIKEESKQNLSLPMTMSDGLISNS